MLLKCLNLESNNNIKQLQMTQDMIEEFNNNQNFIKKQGKIIDFTLQECQKLTDISNKLRKDNQYYQQIINVMCINKKLMNNMPASEHQYLLCEDREKTLLIKDYLNLTKEYIKSIHKYNESIDEILRLQTIIKTMIEKQYNNSNTQGQLIINKKLCQNLQQDISYLKQKIDNNTAASSDIQEITLQDVESKFGILQKQCSYSSNELNSTPKNNKISLTRLATTTCLQNTFPIKPRRQSSCYCENNRQISIDRTLNINQKKIPTSPEISNFDNKISNSRSFIVKKNK